MTLVDEFNDQEIYDYVKPEDFPVLRYSLAEATVDDAICHATGANSVTQRKENLRIKYQRLSKIVVAQSIDGIRSESEERIAAYLEYFSNQQLPVENPFTEFEIKLNQPVALHLYQEEQLIIAAVCSSIAQQ